MGDTQDVSDENPNDSATMISNEEERQKLLEEVKRIRDRIYELQSSIGIHRFSELELEKDSSNDSSSSSESDFETVDVEAEIQDELFKLAGIWCSRFDEDCVFNFRAGNSAEDDVYCVQILNDGGSGKLGCFYMPVGLDITEIESVHPIEEFRKVKPFVRSCKRYLHCYSARQAQYSEMKEILSAIKNCTCDSTFSCTSVRINIYGVRVLETAEVFDVTIHLRYKFNETLPYKLVTAVKDDKLPDDLYMMLHSYYKCFKEMKLKDAFEEIAGNRSTIFSWTKTERVYPINDAQVPNLLSMDSTGSEDELSAIMDKSKKEKKKRGKAASDKARHEQSTRSEESFVDSEKSAEYNVEDVDESDLPQTSKLNNTVGSKKINKKAKKGKQQTILNCGFKSKMREVDEDLKAIIDDGKTTQEECRDGKNGTRKNQTKKNVSSKLVNFAAKSHEQQSEQTSLKQLGKARKPFKNTEAMKAKRFEQLYKELNEVKEKQTSNNMNQEESAEVVRSEKDDVTSKYKVQNKQAEAYENRDKNHQSNTKTVKNGQNKDSDESQSDADKDLPERRPEEVQSNNAANPEMAKSNRKTKTIQKNRIGNKFLTCLNDMDESETSSKSSDSDEDENRPTTNKFENDMNMPESQKKHCSALLTPSTSEDTDAKSTKYNNKNRQHIKRKKLSLIQEIGTDTEDQIEKSERFEWIEPVERNKSDEKGNDTVGQTPQSLNQPIGLRFSTPLSLNENQTISQKKSKIAATKFRRLEQIREQDVANVEVANSTPISGEILNEVNFSDLAEISNIRGADKGLGEDQPLEKEPEREERSSLENSQRKRKLFQDGEKNRKRSQIHEDIEAFRRSLSNEKEDNSVGKGRKRRKKPAKKTKNVSEPDTKKGEILSSDRQRESSEDSEDDRGSNLFNGDKSERDKSDERNESSKMSKDKTKKGKVSDEEVLGDSQSQEERRSNHLLNKDQKKRDKSVGRDNKPKRNPKSQENKAKVLRKCMETELSADTESEEEIIHHDISNFFSNDDNERGKSVERDKTRRVTKPEVKKRKISRRRIETEVSQESELDEDLRNNNSLYNDKNERSKSVESATARRKKKSEAVDGREEIESSADSDNDQKKNNKKYKDANSRDKSVERDRVKKLLKTDAKKRKPLQSNQETESSEDEVVLSKGANNLIRQEKNKRRKSVERGRSRKPKIDAKKEKTSRKREEIDFSEGSESAERRKNNNLLENGGKKLYEDKVKKQKIKRGRKKREIFEDNGTEKMSSKSPSDHKTKKSKSVEREETDRFPEDELKEKMLHNRQEAVFTEESDINEKRNNDFFNAKKKKRYKRSVERSQKSSGEGKVQENKENDSLNQGKNKRSKSMDRSKLWEKVINFEDKRNAKENWSEIVNTDSSDHYLSDEDLFTDQEVLKDLAYIKQVSELKPMTTKHKNNIKKRTKKQNYCVK